MSTNETPGRPLDPRPVHGPRDLPGWYDARARGQVRDVPELPPVPVVSPSALGHLKKLGLAVAATSSAVAGIVLLDLLDGHISTTTGAAVVIVSAAAMRYLARTSRDWGEALVAEARHGYTTAPIRAGTWWRLPSPRDGDLRRGATWDLTGLWWLAEDGTVISPPDRDRDPAGMSPGPDGRWQLWTGSSWIDYRPPGFDPDH